MTYHENKEFVAPTFMPNTVEIVPDAGVVGVWLVEYGGPVRPESYPPMVNVANMVNANLVEIALYVAWYPKLTHVATFTFQLEADLPANFVPVVNGARGDETGAIGRRVTRWKSYGPVGDIALIAAPGLQMTASTGGGSTIEIYYDKVPKSYVDSMKADLRRSMDDLRSLLGPPQGENLVRVRLFPAKDVGLCPGTVDYRLRRECPDMAVTTEIRVCEGFPVSGARDVSLLVGIC